MSETINSKTRLNKRLREKILLNLRESIDFPTELEEQRKSIKKKLNETVREHQALIPKNVADFLKEKRYVKVERSVRIFELVDRLVTDKDFTLNDEIKTRTDAAVEDLDDLILQWDEQTSRSDGTIYHRRGNLAPKSVVSNDDGGINRNDFRCYPHSNARRIYSQPIDEVILDVAYLCRFEGVGRLTDEVFMGFIKSDDNLRDLLAFHRDVVIYGERKLKLVGSARIVLDSVRTVGSLLKQWPEVEPYLPEFREVVENAPSQMAQNISQANAMLAELNPEQAPSNLKEALAVEAKKQQPVEA